jgi:hypothetical protein
MVWCYSYEGDARFAPGDEKAIPRSAVADVYASIQMI